MKFGKKNVKLPFGIVLDGWEVLLGGGLACIVVGLVATAAHFLVWVGIGLIVLWVIMVFLVNLGIIGTRPSKPKEGGGSSPPSGG